MPSNSITREAESALKTVAVKMVKVEEKIVHRFHDPGEQISGEPDRLGEDSAIKEKTKQVLNKKNGGSGQEKQSKGSEANDSGKKADSKGKNKDASDKKPAGGYDPTPLHPYRESSYLIKITFHSGTRLPGADFRGFTADPYILAQLDTPSVLTRHKQDPALKYRGKTLRNTKEPVWEDEWFIAGVPKEGGTLRVWVMDEDEMGRDDKMGHFKVHFGDLGAVGGFHPVDHQNFPLKKRKASKRVNLGRALCTVVRPHRLFQDKMDRIEDCVTLSIEVVEKISAGSDKNVGKPYTVGPARWWQHYSPLLGRIAGTKDPEEQKARQARARENNKPAGNGQGENGDSGDEGNGNGQGRQTGTKRRILGRRDKDEDGEVQRYDFQANEIQFPGPVPPELYHRFVDFKWFVNGMFMGVGIRGRILNKALHHQHARIYNYDSRTTSGMFDLSEGHGEDLTRKFLELAHHDQGGRLYTYVITLDGMFRFCETGEEFSVDMLSKHTMHSDVNVYIAWSGEFLIRRTKRSGDSEEGGTHPPNELDGGEPNGPSPDSPKFYELIIDNDSGTYRPNADLLPVLKSFLEKVLPGLRIRVFNCTDDKLDKIKKQQKETKKKEGEGIAFMQDSDSDTSSISSSDLSDLGHRAEGQTGGEEGGRQGKKKGKHRSKRERGIGALESPAGEMRTTADDMRAALQ